MIRILEQTQAAKCEDFLSLVFGAAFRDMAHEHIATQFSTALSRQTFLVDWDQDSILAAGAVSPLLFCQDTWGIGWISVHPAQRHAGLGTRIVRACIAEIRTHIHRRSTILLSVYPNLAGFYERLGFSGRTEDHEGSPYLSLPVDPFGSTSLPQ